MTRQASGDARAGASSGAIASPDSGTIELARRARESGVWIRLGGDATGPASLGAIRARGADALAFLHSQVTNDVEGLAPGQGNRSARVTRQGQLQELFSVHRLADDPEPALLLVLERDRVGPLEASLDEVLFADRVVLEDVSNAYVWFAVQGPAAAGVLDETLPAPAGSFAEAPSGSIVQPTGDGVPDGTQVIARSLTGDAGYLVLLPADAPGLEAAEARLASAAEAGGLAHVEGAAADALLEVLRIEAGVVRIGPDSAGRKRILPETGLEGQTVSYTKGCYLGQEVIARVRTYGKLPYALRGLVLSGDELLGDAPDATELLAALPEPRRRSAPRRRHADRPGRLAHLLARRRRPGRLRVSRQGPSHPGHRARAPGR